MNHRIPRYANRSATLAAVTAGMFVSMLVPSSSAADLPEQQVVNRYNGARWTTGFIEQ